MHNRSDRFECRQELAGLWTVWDKITSTVATLGGSVLVGQRSDRATMACAVLSKIYRNRLDLNSVRLSRA